MDKLEISERFAQMWVKSRQDAGKSVAYMARSMGVAVKTIENWENGTSCPNLLKAMEWFHALDLQPLPYFLQLLYPSEFKDIKPSDDDKRIIDALERLITDLPPASKRKLLYMLYGDHGSNPVALLDLITAYLQTPLADRVNLASAIITNYIIAERFGTLVQPEHAQPDMEVLKEATNASFEAVLEGKRSYINIEE